MPHAYGYRAGTRHKFSKPFKQHGAIHIARQLTNFHIGDYVDIIVDGAIHKGMPHKYYHGRTGRVFNVNPRSVGVVVNKNFRNRIIKKRIHVRFEHLRQSTSRLDFLKRIKENDKLKAAARKAGNILSTKRQPPQQREEHLITGKTIKYQHPVEYSETW
mmetsp:Transcript_15141/g.12877  ORF Transcript_15141/g.12877 Transcript_15141/m.12877 type:complete len:159 (-) Transcript_15141:277-753(-)|eukprot:CAMPEP_0114585622 /NCGR_PEP_ID=MMETSP0125-20121206/9102_1 /TAXON_ID=485358 ORGANISM="Aristerostoma sp., Strain ATCC 50986" /NCGR_SAMPLE_ID=MMETSP0125 /ASSEMBLY_ACC=CAM_ASM_000245 /LENGTH=158 /DNA_ID=CAMNT_0001780757 /DNA_START=84 /DNA_END=560 /DNA_ORIENTATION=+